MTVDPIALRKVASNFATGVTIVSTKHVGGGGCGLTVNAFASVSLEPPLVLVSVDRGALTYPCLRAAGVFAASFLSSGQRDLAIRFAERREDKFDGVAFSGGVTGAPILEGSIGHVECEVEQEYAGGDHALFLGRVVSAAASDEGEPLVFFRRAYTTIPDTVRE